MQTRLTDFIDKNNATTFWILEAKTGKKLASYTEETTEKLKETLLAEFEYLTDQGNYILKASKTVSGFTNAKELRFRVGNPQTQTNRNTMNFDELERIRKEAYNEGIKYGKELSRIDALEVRCLKIEEKVNKIITLLEANSDDDDENDMNVTQVLKPLIDTGVGKVARKFDALEW